MTVGFALLLCFPVGLALVWSSAYKLVTKWVLTGVVVNLVVLTMIVGALTPPKEAEVDTAAPPTTEVPATTKKRTLTTEAPTTTVGPTTTVAPTTTEAPAPTTTKKPTTTTTMAPMDEALIGRMAIGLAMCDNFGGMDPGFFIDWCTVDPDGADLIGLVDATCDTLDSIDPTGTMSDEEITNAYVYSIGLLMVSGDVTQAQAESLAAMGGAVQSVRDSVC